MPVPKKKRSKSKKRIKRACWKLTLPTLGNCSNCGEPVQPHHACKACGYYKGKQVIQIKVKTPETQEG